VGSGVRRVEAYVGLESFRHLAKERALMAGLASSLNARSEEVPARVANLVERLKAAEKELERSRRGGLAATVAGIEPERIGSFKVVAKRMPAEAAADLRSLVGDIRGKLGSDPAVVALIAEGEGGSVPYVIAANPAAQDLGIKANELIKQLAGAVDGRGGGKPDLAQGSGKDPSGIETALDALRAEIARVG
jgi:alanyl-tRNA synthetase